MLTKIGLFGPIHVRFRFPNEIAEKYKLIWIGELRQSECQKIHRATLKNRSFNSLVVIVRFLVEVDRLAEGIKGCMLTVLTVRY